MRKIIFLVSLIGIFILHGCGSGNNVRLDNPGQSDITFDIDGSSHTVKANSGEWINLSAGSHKVSVKGGSKSFSSFPFEVKEGGVLHSGESKYVTWKLLYGLEQYRKTELKEDTLLVDSVLYFCDCRLTGDSTLFIEKNWDHGLEEEFPVSKSLPANKDFTTMSKIFRAEDFVKEYKKRSTQK